MTPELTKEQITCLHSLDTREFLRPMDIGGKDGSHHSNTLASLAKLGLVERKKRHAIHCTNGSTSRQELVGYRWVYTHNHPPYEGCSCRGSCVYRRTRKGTAWLRRHAAINNLPPPFDPRKP